VYAPDKPYKVFCSPCWWSDGWDELEHGLTYNMNQPFFVQFSALMHKVPLLARFVYEDTMVRSDYANMANNLKDCYLMFNSGGKVTPCQRCAYGDQVDLSNDCLDVSHCSRNELCYECTITGSSYRLFYSRNSDSCRDCWFVKNCTGCSDCFGCVNLRNKSYHIFNQPYTKEGYAAKIAEMGFDSGSHSNVEKFKKLAGEFWLTAPVKYYEGVQNNNVSGNGIFNCKNVADSFYVIDTEDSKFCAFLFNKVRDSYDWTQYGDGGELVYEMLQSGEGVYNNRFGWCIWRQSHDTEYGILNVNCSNCFGCIGLKNKQFCILNTQYSETEYKELRQVIIGHMDKMPYVCKRGREFRYGEYFPPELSPFGYNESTAMDEFPVTETQATTFNYPWFDMERYRGNYQVSLSSDAVPDSIDDVADSILEEIIGCEKCGRAFRLIPMELAFYRNQRIPIPRLCFSCRYLARHELRNPMQLFQGHCMCVQPGHAHKGDPCSNRFQTSYSPDRKEIIYCESCFNSEVA